MVAQKMFSSGERKKSDLIVFMNMSKLLCAVVAERAHTHGDSIWGLVEKEEKTQFNISNANM